MTPGAGPHGGSGVSFGIDIGGTKVLGVALDQDDRIAAEARVATPRGTGRIDAGDVADAVSAVVGELTAGVRTSAAVPSGPASSRSDPPPVAVGAPGMVDRHGRLRFAPNLPEAHGVDWAALHRRPPARAPRR